MTAISMGFSLLTIAALYMGMGNLSIGILASLAVIAMGRAIYAHEVS